MSFNSFVVQYIVEEGGSKQLQNINNTYTCYKKIVDYCVQNPEAVEKVNTFRIFVIIFKDQRKKGKNWLPKSKFFHPFFTYYVKIHLFSSINRLFSPIQRIKPE